MALLTLSNLSKRYGALVVADGVSLELAAGEALGIIGPNGAGKTTLFNLITGTVTADAGTVRLRDRVLNRMTPAERCRLGVARSFQIPHPFGGMTVFENVLVGAAFGARRTGRDADRSAVDVLDATDLLGKANRLAGSLTLLERKRLELARALATEPELLLLDEIAGGLTEGEVHELVGAVNDIRARGVAIIWIEHIVHALLAAVDRLVVLNFGRVIAEGDPRAVIASPEVAEIYMGIEAGA